MFGLFNKKESFIDIWSGTPDIHCHVLPGIDDGAKDTTTSELLLKKYASLGCKKIIATPHTMGGIYDNTPETILNARKSIVDTSGIELSCSSEYMLDDNFDKLLKKNKIIPLKDKYLLVEMSFFQPPENLFEQLFKISTKGYTSIMAHPERYAYYHQNFKKYRDFKAKGIKLQLNVLSLTSHYGESVKQTTYKLLEEGLYDFIGTDTHKIEHLEKIEKITIPKKYAPALSKLCLTTQQVFS
ncbi:tyrosine-protein phosphatase [Dokdonia sp. Hel_I_53]|uniref:tyrosine-protein phosphatase n=1 Tax=Dokdonia sp. Hel_I_53 TaxID=1566287 RepID=UPI0011991582|nr:CpsB/CapC family capsule biosynthesis tyrosine phosphatase [Dokdonia sp. Hel_I_53]TVZ51357.1 protein-tyrosine phosphatase [Dokdonia sp. Hel_I_53]